MSCGGIHRRAFLRGLGSVPLVGLFGGRASFAQGNSGLRFVSQHTPSMFPDLMASSSLFKTAQSSGRYFGAAARIEDIDRDSELRELLLRDFSSLTPEIHLKWDSLEWTKGEFNFSPVDDLLNFAEQNGKQLRGHTLVWEQSTPPWAKREILVRRDWRLVAEHFSRVLSRYRGRIGEWDVVNEAIDTEHGAEGLRATCFYRAFGPQYVERALREARALEPAARLLINDYGFEYENPVDEARRTAFLDLLTRLTAAGAPLDGVGLQAHLDLSKGRIRPATIERFVHAIAGLGLDVTITELDVKESDARAPIDVRDERVAEHTHDYLDVVLAQPAVRGLVTWGLSDKYSWLSDATRVADAAAGLNRGLPYDAGFVPKRMYAAIGGALTSARNSGAAFRRPAKDSAV
jgi:endo-1,4-beta-xylanase